MSDVTVSRKRVRKSRGRGLRSTSGCLTCRKRHKKCDDRRPICGPCSISDRPCAFATRPEHDEVSVDDGPSFGASSPGLSVDDERNGHGLLSPAIESIIPGISISETSASNLYSSVGHNAETPRHIGVESTSYINNAFASETTYQQLGEEGHQTHFACSPDTIASDLLTADLASTRWLDLLAQDAAHADKTFSLAPTRASSPVPVQTVLPLPRNNHETAPSATTNWPIDPELALAEQRAWQLSSEIKLQDHECRLLRSFVDHSSSWLDLCDGGKHFSTHAVRLALRNLGLMKAILALTTRHHLGKGITQDSDINSPVQYYYETLHYVQEMLQYATYTRSEELLATVIIVSTYEMLDNANGNWQRHLKGVFWIQRSQNVNGASGGLRQAVWWAWLRQDLWAAFKEKRPCFSFWKPTMLVGDLSQDQLANRAIYLLSQTVNFVAMSGNSEMEAQFVQRGAMLTQALEEWQSCLGPAYRPLPTSHTHDSNSHFKPIWIHPPHYGVALQAYHFAKILLTLHRPCIGGMQAYLQTQRALIEAINTICGIAMGLRDEGCQVLSAQCLYGAGLCTQDIKIREGVVDLIRDCERRCGWPVDTLINDLRAEWARYD